MNCTELKLHFTEFNSFFSLKCMKNVRTSHIIEEFDFPLSSVFCILKINLP